MCGKKIVAAELNSPVDRYPDIKENFFSDGTKAPAEVEYRTSSFSHSKEELNELKQKNGFLIVHTKDKDFDVDQIEIDHADLMDWIVKEYPKTIAQEEESNASIKNKKEVLCQVYNKFIFEKFKEDRDFNLIPYTAEDKLKFMTERQSGAWVNFGVKDIQQASELLNEIHIGIYNEDNKEFSLFISADTNPAVEKVIALPTELKSQLVSEYQKLPHIFTITVSERHPKGQSAVPQGMIQTEIYSIPCKDINSIKDLEDLLDFVEDLLDISRKIGGGYPAINLVKTYVKPEEIPAALERMRAFYKLLIYSKPKEEYVIDQIKKLDSWQWKVNYCLDCSSNKLWQEINRTDITEEELKKICKKIKKTDADYKKWFAEYFKE